MPRGLPVAIGTHAGAHSVRRVVPARDACEGLDAGIEGGEPQRIAAAQADPDGPDALGMHLGARAQERNGRPQVGELALWILVAARLALRLAEAAVVERQRDVPGGRQPLGVQAGHLVADAGKRPGEHQAGRPGARRRRPKVTHQPDAVCLELDALHGLAPIR